MPQLCDYKGPMEMIDKPSDAPNWLRCPKCGRRLKPHIYNCHHPWPDEPCWHYGVPPHKPKGWWKKKKKIRKEVKSNGRRKNLRRL